MLESTQSHPRILNNTSFFPGKESSSSSKPPPELGWPFGLPSPPFRKKAAQSCVTFFNNLCRQYKVPTPKVSDAEKEQNE